MSRTLVKSLFIPGLILRAWITCCAFVLISFAGIRLGTSDIPELPTGDGTGDTPDMFIKLVPNTLAPAGKGDELRLSSLRGRIVLLDMFWSQCPHCEEHAPHVVEFYNQYRQRGFTVLGLATDRPEKADDVRSFIKKTKINYPVGYITTEVIAYYADSQNQGVPQMILFGTDGKMFKRLIGWNPEISKELKLAIETLMSKQPTVKPGSKASSKASPSKIKQV